MDAAGWDARYAATERIWSAEANPLVVETFSGLPTGSALDVGTGEGRHAIWLAERGWTVTAVDFSAEAVRKACALQVAHAPATVGRVTWLRSDVVAEAPSPGAYDAVVVMYLQLPAAQRRTALRGAARALAPGGTLLVVGHDSANLAEGAGGPQDPAVLSPPGTSSPTSTAWPAWRSCGRSGSPARSATTAPPPSTRWSSHTAPDRPSRDLHGTPRRRLTCAREAGTSREVPGKRTRWSG